MHTALVTLFSPGKHLPSVQMNQKASLETSPMKTSCYRHKPRAYLVYLTAPSPEKGLLLATNLEKDHSNSYNNLRHPAGDFSPTSPTTTFLHRHPELPGRPDPGTVSLVV